MRGNAGQSFDFRNFYLFEQINQGSQLATITQLMLRTTTHKIGMLIGCFSLPGQLSKVG
jgi:hypothetical protein